MKLAVHGGTKEITRPLGKALGHEVDKEARAVRAVLAKGRAPLARGPFNMALRAAAGKRLGIQYTLPVSSGTAAVHTALAGLGVGPGDEVITSPCTDYGTIAGILQLGANIVFADLASDAAGIDPQEVAKKVSRRTRVILPVHNSGIPVDLAPILKLAQRRGIRVIEDCAQAWGTRYGRKHVGTLGDIGAFSLNESKHIACGEGGLVCTRSKELIEACERFSDKCYDRIGTGRSPYELALNYRLSEINAAIALEQLKLLPWLSARRNAVGEALRRGIARMPGVRFFRVPPNVFISYWVFPFWMEPEVLGITPQEFAKALQAEGVPVGCGVQPVILRWELFKKLNANPHAFRNYRPVGLKKGAYDLADYPHATRLATQSLRMGISEGWSAADVRRVLRAIEKVADWYAQERKRERVLVEVTAESSLKKYKA